MRATPRGQRGREASDAKIEFVFLLMSGIKCRICKVNDTPGEKYLCESCLCIVPGCVDVKKSGSHFCEDHNCDNCKNANGELYKTSGDYYHIMDINKIDKKEYFIDFDLCSYDTFQTFHACEYFYHCEVCNKHNNIIPYRYLSITRDGYYHCEKLNKCTKPKCWNTIKHKEIKRCETHSYRCNVCSNYHIKKGSNRCERCTKLDLIHCYRCKDMKIYNIHFSNGKDLCLLHAQQTPKQINITVHNKIIINMDAEIANTLRYIFILHKCSNKSKKHRITGITSLPKDVFNIIICYIIALPPVLTYAHYASHPHKTDSILTTFK
jgi:hypothetical protein